MKLKPIVIKKTEKPNWHEVFFGDNEVGTITEVNFQDIKIHYFRIRIYDLYIKVNCKESYVLMENKYSTFEEAKNIAIKILNNYIYQFVENK